MSSENATRVMRPPLLTDPQIAEFAEQLKAPAFIAQMLLKLGVNEVEEARDFFISPLEKTVDPFLLKDMDVAVALMKEALQANSKVLIHGDYDLDGISGTALLYSALHALGAEIETFLPSRFEHGYGLNSISVQEFKDQGVELLIMVDTGVSALAEIALAKEAGMKVIVLDHHQPGEELPPADAMVNPHRKDCTYPQKTLAGVGVAYKFIEALYIKLGKGTCKEFLDFLVLGTLADMMPLTGDNRRYLRNGLKHLAHSVFPGIRALAVDAGLRPEFLRSQDISFKMVPLLNAPGRMGHPGPALQMLTSHNAKEANQLLQKLKDLNEDRKQIESRIAEQAVSIVQNSDKLKENKVLLLKSSAWHLGVIGIVSAKIVNMFKKPAMILHEAEDGTLHGSARGVEGFDWYKALEANQELLDRWGGHPIAAGCSLQVAQFEAFDKGVQEYAAATGFAGLKPKPICPDYDLPIDQLTPELMTWLHRFEPFGNGNPEPLFYSKGVQVNGRCRIVGSEHLQLDVVLNGAFFSAIAFGKGHLREDVLAATEFGIAYYPTWNFFRGKRSIQLMISGFDLNSI